MFIILLRKRVRVDVTIAGESRTHYHLKFDTPVRLRGRFIEVGQEIAVQKLAVILEEDE
jgi:hypothetical protein